MAVMKTPPTVCQQDGDTAVYKALKDFELMLFADLDASHVLAGNQNNLALPPSREYIINTVLDHRNVGTPVQGTAWDEENKAAEVVLSQLVEITAQIDCYSNSPETARSRAETITIVGRSVPGTDFFSGYGISSLYADDAKNLTNVVDENQFVQRWMTTLHLTYVHRLRLDTETFTTVGVRVKNADVYFPPNKKSEDSK